MNPKTETLMDNQASPESSRQTFKKSISGSPNQGLFGATLGFFVGFAAVSLFGPTANLLNQNMMMTSVQLGLLVAMPSLSGSLLRIPFGAWVDTTGGRKPFLILLFLSAAGMAGLFGLFWITGPENLSIDYYPLLLVFALLCGCGIATFSVGIGQVSYWFPKKRQGWALGAYAGFGNIAPGLFSYMVPLLIGAVAITATYGIWLAFLLSGIVVYYFFAPNAWFFQLRSSGRSFNDARNTAADLGQELFPQEGVWTGLIKAAKIWRTWPLVFLYFTTFGGFLALTAWFPTYWQEFFNKPLAVAGGFTMLYSVLASVIRVPGGIIADKVGGIATIIVSMTTTLVGGILLIWGESMAMAVVGLLLMAIGMGISNAGVFKLVPQYIEEAVGGGSGWVGGLGALGGFVIPPVMGWFVEAQGDTGYANGFLVFVVLSVISLGLVLLLKQTETGSNG